MSKIYMSSGAVILTLSLLSAIYAEPVTVSLGVQNVAPTLSGLTGTRNGSLLTVSFLLEDSNTIADVERVIIVIWHKESSASMQRFTWEGIGSDWNPQPMRAEAPSPELRRSKGFHFSLTIMQNEAAGGMVLVTAVDSGNEKVHATIVLAP
ncbi:MAG: hypothetical protein HXS40_02185 [Theionarchaea archaeon]|nr:hypothetical protein [Theionarchaea archaeon]